MSKEAILVDLERCVGCWTCGMSCKIAHHLGVDEYRLSVRTIGSGGIDEPIGSFPDLYMSWMPTFSKKCTMCVDRKSEGKMPFCMQSCPAKAIIHGDIEDAESAISKKRIELLGRNYREIRLPAWESTRQPVYYYTKGV
jgi:molybdopterin-containing oxidoreductase family iron-sulfur binding subunit